MNKNIAKLIIFLFSVFLLTQGTPAEDGEKSISLTLEDCIIKALKHNLNVKVEVLNPRLSDISLSQSKEKFLPEFSFSFTKRNTESASYSWLDASDQVATKTEAYSMEISQFLPTGGTITASLDNDKSDTNRNFQTINPRYGSTLQLTLSQPLLKNFGFKTNRRDIIIAKNNLRISEYRFKSVLQDTVYNVESAYWNLVYSIENLKVIQQALDLANDLLRKNKRSVEVGTLAPIEVKNAEAEVATREADILQAQAQVENNTDQLKRIINLSDWHKGQDPLIVPVDRPVFKAKDITVEEAVDIALKNRPDVLEQKINIKNDIFDVDYAKNQLLPNLNLTASVWSPGISGTRLIYENNDPLTGVVIDTEPGGAGDALKDALDFAYNNWSVSLNLEIPLSSIISRTQLAQARVTLDQSKLRLQDTIQQILLDIKQAVRTVNTNFKRVNAYKIARELTQKKLEAEEEKLRVGRSTNYNVLLTQRDFSTARTNELKAIVD
jgi:outer membrane protein TolC